MPVISTPTQFSMQACFNILLQHPATKEIRAYLTNLKSSSLENTME